MYSGKFIDITSASENSMVSVSDLIRMGLRRELLIYAWDEWSHIDIKIEKTIGEPLSLRKLVLDMRAIGNYSFVAPFPVFLQSKPTAKITLLSLPSTSQPSCSLHFCGLLDSPPRRVIEKAVLNKHSVDSPILIDDDKYLTSLMKGKSITLRIDSDDRFICNLDATDDNYLDGVKVTQSDLFCLKSKIEELKHKKSVETQKTETVKIIDTVNQSGDGGIESKKPWEIHNPDDPLPAQPWYTPARYFARELVKKDSTLLLKKDSLAAKVVRSLSEVRIYKRGGKRPFDPGTVKKAFSNISLS